MFKNLSSGSGLSVFWKGMEALIWSHLLNEICMSLTLQKMIKRIMLHTSTLDQTVTASSLSSFDCKFVSLETVFKLSGLNYSHPHMNKVYILLS